MKYRVMLIESDQGFAVCCPAMPGCWSQGHTEAEALDNIQDAIRDYLTVREEIEREQAVAEGATVRVREVELATA
jgi:predicted RNase H-like HicB family nuclease